MLLSHLWSPRHIFTKLFIVVSVHTIVSLLHTNMRGSEHMILNVISWQRRYSDFHVMWNSKLLSVVMFTNKMVRWCLPVTHTDRYQCWFLYDITQIGSLRWATGSDIRHGWQKLATAGPLLVQQWQQAAMTRSSPINNPALPVSYLLMVSQSGHCEYQPLQLDRLCCNLRY